VLHHTEPGHRRQHGAQLAEALSIPVAQGVEELPSTTVGQRLEHGVVDGG